MVQNIQSERYISDLSFYKEGTFNHRLTNVHNNEALVTLQEFFPSYLRPYMH